MTGKASSIRCEYAKDTRENDTSEGIRDDVALPQFLHAVSTILKIRMPTKATKIA